MGRIVWLASYPRSGNTWVRSLITAHLNPHLPSPLDDLVVSTRANERGLLDEMMGFDTADLLEDESQNLRPQAYERLSRDVRDRAYLKVHDAFMRVPAGGLLFPEQATDRVVYVVRDPRDVCVSLAHFGPGRSLDRAVAILLDREFWVARNTGGRGHPLPQKLGSWPDHVRSWTTAFMLRVHVVRFEDLLEQPLPALAALFAFLGLSTAADSIACTVDRCRFDRLARREAEEGFDEAPGGPAAFFRSGRRGSWSEHLSEAQASRIVAECGDVMREFGYLQPQP